MSTVDSALAKIGFGARKPQIQSWQISAAATEATGKRPGPAPKRSLLGLFRRREPNTYHRCLAVHIHFAGPRSSLS